MDHYLNNITPVDGRYRKKVIVLNRYFSELSFNSYRILIEIEYLISLGKLNIYDNLDEYKINFLRNIYLSFDLEECKKLKEIENEIKHDVKAIEYYLKSKLVDYPEIKNLVHFALTSQDINSSANILMIKDSLNDVLIPKLDIILFDLNEKLLEWSNIVILSMTHGQPASPTYLGKELLVFYTRLEKQINKLKNIKYTTKFGGAVGNFNAHFYAFPQINWFEFADEFTAKLGLERNKYTTQIDNYDNYTEVFDILKRINTIFVDFCQDMWLYISRNILKQNIINKEVGSSTMPHKVNPINFENAEGNLLLSNSLLEFFSRKLPVSRMQRDLTDSTILRNVGTAFSYSLVAYQSILEGMAKIDVNGKAIRKELEDNFVVVAEGIQTKMKINNIENSYETIKELTRSNENSKEELLKFIKDNKEYKNLEPSNYAGKYILTQKI